MKKKPYKHITIEDDLFRAVIHIFVNCEQIKFIEWAIKKFGTEIPLKPANAQFLSILDEEGATSYCLWVESFKWRISEQGSLSHELLHCAITILAERRIPINNDTEEVLAYYHTWLKCKAYEKLK